MPTSFAKNGRRQSRDLPILQMTAIAVVFIYGAVTIEGFTTAPALRAMLVLSALLGLASIGSTLVILVGGLDLAVPGYIALGSVLTAQLYGTSQLPFWEVALIIGSISAVVGGMTGWVCDRFELPALVVTLGTGSVISGFLFAVTGGQVFGQGPVWLSKAVAPISSTFGLPIPPVVVIWILVAIVLGVILRRTVSGRHLYAAGASPVAARFAGVATRRIWVCTFALAGLLNASAGVLIGGFAGGGNQSVGDPYLFQALAAVIVGGVSFGGRGNYWNTVLGALLLTLLGTILVGNGLLPAQQQVIYGVLILAVVGLYGRERSEREKV